MHCVRASTILSNISMFSLFSQVRDKNMTCTTLPTLIAYTKFIHGSSYQIFDAGCSPQLVREVLTMQWTRLAGRLSLSRAEFRTKSDPRLAQIKKKSISHCCNSSFVCGCGYFFASCSARLYAAATRSKWAFSNVGAFIGRTFFIHLFYAAAMGHNVTNQCPSSNPVLPPTLSAS